MSPSKANQQEGKRRLSSSRRRDVWQRPLAYMYINFNDRLTFYTNHAAGFDRDLSIAGRAMVRTTSGDFVQRLIRVDRPSKAS